MSPETNALADGEIVDDMHTWNARERQPFSLDWLLHPIATEDFFHTYWETRPLFIARERPDYYAGLPGLDDVDELITATTSGGRRSKDDGSIVKSDPDGRYSARNIQLDGNGIPDIHSMYRAYHDGYSIVVNRIHRRSAKVSRLCSSLEAGLHHPVGANLYLTPPGGQGFRRHIDTHDVLILQLHGVKEWHVYHPPKEMPLTSSGPPRVKSTSDFLAFTLTPGDLLYLPRGWPHEAMTAAYSSLHLTVGMHVYKWIDIVREALDLCAEEKAEFRKALPPKYLDAPLNETRISGLAHEFAHMLSEDSLLERAKGRLAERLLGRIGVKAYGGHFRSLDAISDLTGESVVARARDQICWVETNAGEVRIKFAANYVSGPLCIEPALRFVAERDCFAVSDLPGGLTPIDKIDLVSRLISEGLLERIDEYTKKGI